MLKSLLASILALSACLQPPAQQVVVWSNSVECAWLEHQYDAYNDVYFSGKLPTQVIVVVGDSAARDMGQLADTSLGPVILIDYRLNPDGGEQLITMLHEMCHLTAMTEFSSTGLLLAHGPKFHACMRRLMDEGAFDDLL
jgi:hypothetical protein